MLALPDVREDLAYGIERYEGFEVAGHLSAPLMYHDRVIGALSAVTREPRSWTSGDVAFISTLATHAAIALANAELFEQTVARAAQLEVLQAASARLSRATTIDEIGRTIVEETGGIIDYHNARVYLVEGSDVVPIAFEGRVGAYELVDLALLTCKLGEGFTGWVAEHGEPILVNDANRDPRGATIAGTDDIDESMLVVPMRYDGVTIGVITLSKLGLDGFGSDDLRLLTILADRAATAVGSARLLTRTQDLAGELRRLLDMSAELSGSLDPRQVADLMAAPPRARDRRRRVRHQLLGPAGRPGRVARLLPQPAARGARAVLRRGRLSRRRCASSNGRRPSSSTPRTRRRPGRGRAHGPGRQPGPGHAAAGRQGPVDRPGRADLARDR